MAAVLVVEEIGENHGPAASDVKHHRAKINHVLIHIGLKKDIDVFIITIFVGQL